MQHLDSDYMEELIARLAAIPPDAEPAWGSLRRDTLIAHLLWIVRHSMGRSRKIPFYGNWMTRHVIAPLVLRGFLPIPGNRRLPRPLREQGLTDRESGDLEDLHALLEDYLNLVQADEFIAAPHPIFGDIGADGWEQIHIRHFEHHCRQFRV
jgi:hydroxymethylglutaryl-CoA reductase